MEFPRVTNEAYNLAAYLRVASLAVAIYDFLQTWPASTRFYRQQLASSRISISFILFFLLRILSIAVLTVSNIGFFYSSFTVKACRAFFLVPPIFKVLQAMVSQAILGFRAYNLGRRSRMSGLFIIVFFIGTVALQWLTNIYGRRPGLDPDHGSCTATARGSGLGTWVYYLIAIIYDLGMTIISFTYLLRCTLSSNNSMMSKLTKMMLYDGLGYFVALTAVNFLNLFMYRANDVVKTAAASLAYCVTWIMSQRLLLHLYKASQERRNESINAAVTITQTIETARQVSRAMRSQFEQKGGRAFDLAVPDFDLETIDSDQQNPDDARVEVRIERTVRFEDTNKEYELENYSRVGIASAASENSRRPSSRRG